MIISFDIDNTLIPYSNEFEVENKGLLSKILGAESIRKGSIQLFSELENKGHSIWIYTTSYRSAFNIKKTFKSYGLNPSRIINEETNQQFLKKHNCSASKNPSLFGIDLHVDDARGVEIEGAKYGFETIIIDINDEDWANKILKKIRGIELNMAWRFKELLVTLITLKSNAKKQRAFNGVGQAEDDMVDDFDNFYSRSRDVLMEYDYITATEDSILSKLAKLIRLKCEDPENAFWYQLESHQDWEIIRGLASKVLLKMKKENFEVEFVHTNEFDDGIMLQRTKTKIVEK